MEWVQKMNQVNEVLNSIGRQRFSILPTPFYRLDRLSSEFGNQIYCKRDDLTGFAFGGNKTRKLDYLIGEASARECDSIIAIGAVQSNFCRMAAAAAGAAGMDVYLVLGGGEPVSDTGNLVLDKLMDAKIHYVDSDDWDEWESVAVKLEDGLRKDGRRVYRMPMGGSTYLGCLGYVNAFFEIMSQSFELKVKIGSIVVPVSSGGTMAGLVAGKALCEWPGMIQGFGVAGSEDELRRKVLDLATGAAALLGGGEDLRIDDIKIDNSFMGERYGAFTGEAQKAIEKFAREEGLFMDRVYSGKAAAGLLSYLKEKKFTDEGAVVFIHTGGAVELFE
jgi:D-cysteine desulfhydrase